MRRFFSGPRSVQAAARFPGARRGRSVRAARDDRRAGRARARRLPFASPRISRPRRFSGDWLVLAPPFLDEFRRKARRAEAAASAVRRTLAVERRELLQEHPVGRPIADDVMEKEDEQMALPFELEQAAARRNGPRMLVEDFRSPARPAFATPRPAARVRAAGR